MRVVFFVYKPLQSINKQNISPQQIIIIVRIVRKNIY